MNAQACRRSASRSSMRAALVCATWVCATAATLAVADLPRQSAVPGGVVLIDLPGTAPPTVTFEDKRVMVMPKGAGWVAIVGIPLARSATQPRIHH